MASNSQKKQPGSHKGRLPFEPATTQKATAQKKTSAQPVVNAAQSTVASAATAMPEVVSQRMLRRIMGFCGVPTVLGLAAFPTSYVLKNNIWSTLPNAVVVITTMGLFGLGLLGISYGALSASWDEDKPGSPLGWSEFRLNLSRITETWRSQREHQDS